MLATLLLLLSAQAPPADRAWQFELVRSWLERASNLDPRATEPAGSARLDELAPGPRATVPVGAIALPPGSAPFEEVAALVNRPCALTAGPMPPQPNGPLWDVDLDGDRIPERLFSGGCSPDPYTVALKRGPRGWGVWYSAEGLLLATRSMRGGVVFASAREGYGVSREKVLTLALVQPDGKLAQRARFSAVGEQRVELASTRAGPCAVRQRTDLRIDPKVRTALEESGMGFDYPGNLLQTLASGSRGLSLGSARGWRLCAFAHPPAPLAPEDSVKAMRTPALLTLTPEPSELLVGWVQESALEQRAK